MTDEALTTDGGEEIATERDVLAEAMSRFDAVVDPVVSQFSHAMLINGHHLQTVVRTIRAGLVAALSNPGTDSGDDPEPSRDETHASIDEHGAPTPEALAAVAEAKASDTPLPGTVDPEPAAEPQTPADPEEPAQ